MNFHPGILVHVAFLDKPRSLKDLYRVVGLIEEKFAVAKERQRVEKPVHLARSSSSSSSSSSNSRVGPRNASRVAPVRSMTSARCWICVQSGHFRRNCLQKPALSGNARRPEAARPPGKGRKWAPEN
jgi:hypothetical protein